jgi:hypothetical protein
VFQCVVTLQSLTRRRLRGLFVVFLQEARLAQWLNWKHVDALSWVGVHRSALLGQMAKFTRGTDCCASALRALTVLPRNGRKVLLVPYLSTGDFRELC